MVTLFRRILIRFGKVIPFIFAFVVALSYAETIYSVSNDIIIEDENGGFVYYLPISNYIGNIVYIDWFDVLLLYVLAVALEFCQRNMLAVHYLLLNLVVRTLVERFYLDLWVIIPLAGFMALCGLYCVYSGFKMLPQQKRKF